MDYTYSDLRSGRATVGLAAAAIVTDVACKGILITALSTNTVPVFIGDSTVVAAAGSETGTPLAAGASVFLKLDNTKALYARATVAAQAVVFNRFY